MLRNFRVNQDAGDLLNVAAFCPRVTSHGPGLRAVVWVQGCPFHCTGCIAPEWQEQRTADLVPIEILGQYILAQPDLSGLTLSGGEPMLQAVALAGLAEKVRQQRPALDLICFTGYQWKDLIARAALGDTGIERLLGQVDVLIDGPYIQAQDNGRGLRGSANQVVHRLTETGRKMRYDFENAPRQVEIYVSDGQYLLSGVPPTGLLDALGRA